MNNVLVDELPTAVMIDGQEYEINSDFRTCIRIIMAFEDNDLAALEKQMILVESLYPVKPENLQEAFEKGIKFLNGGGESNGEEKEEGLRLYSFAKDANFIFAAFKQTHGVDLSDSNDLHWWKFLALFADLGADTTFCNLVSLRKKVKTGKATKEERQAAYELGEMFEVEDIDTRTIEEKEAHNRFMELVNAGKR